MSRAARADELPLLGRDAELAALEGAFGRERLVVLGGAPGVGKSALAAAWCRRVGGVLATVERSGAAALDALSALATALGLTARTEHAEVLLRAIADRLDGTATLVVDTQEAAPALVEALVDVLEAAPDLRVLLSGRGVAPAGRVVLVSPLDAGAAAALLEARVARAGAAAPLEPSDAATVLAFARGNPAVIGVLAAWVAQLGGATVAERLRRQALRFDALDDAVAAAWSTLDGGARRAVVAVSVAEGGLELADVPELASLAAARSAGLVEVIDGVAHASPWVRDAALRWADPGDVSAAWETHARRLVAAAPSRLDREPEVAALRRRRRELLAAWRWAAEARSPLAVGLALGLDPLLLAEGSVATHREVLDGSLDGAAGDSRALLLFARGRLDAIRGRHVAAIAWFEAGHAAAASERIRGWGAAFWAYACRGSGALDRAGELAAAAQATGEALREPRLVAMAEQVLSAVARRRGDLPGALAGAERSRAAAVVARDDRLVGIALGNRGLALRDHDVAAADAAFAEAEAVFRRCGDRVLTLRVATDRAALAALSGNPPPDAPLLAALDDAALLDDVETERAARRGLVLAALARGEGTLARRRQGELEALCALCDDVEARDDAARLRARVDAQPGQDAALVVSRDGRRVVLDGRSLDFSRRGPLRRVLLALVERRLATPGRCTTAAELLEAGWPGEKMRPESGAARVYMAVRRLRELGLEAVLVTTDAGYHLEPGVRVAWRDG